MTVEKGSFVLLRLSYLCLPVTMIAIDGEVHGSIFHVLNALVHTQH